MQNEQEATIWTYILLRMRYTEACLKAKKRGLETVQDDPTVQSYRKKLRKVRAMIDLETKELNERIEKQLAELREENIKKEEAR